MYKRKRAKSSLLSFECSYIFPLNVLDLMLLYQPSVSVLPLMSYACLLYVCSHWRLTLMRQFECEVFLCRKSLSVRDADSGSTVCTGGRVHLCNSSCLLIPLTVTQVLAMEDQPLHSENTVTVGHSC